MAFRVEQNVAIMPVFDLQNVAEERVTCNWLQESISSFSVALAGLAELQLLLRSQLFDTFSSLSDLVRKFRLLLLGEILVFHARFISRFEVLF